MPTITIIATTCTETCTRAVTITRMDDFLLRALAGGIGVALLAGPVGCFVVWRRMAYFGSALAHAGLLGIGIGLLAGVDPRLGMLVVSTAMAVALFVLGRRPDIASDTLLGIFAHASLAAGLTLLAFVEQARGALVSYLFGDVLAVSLADIAWIWLGGAFCLLLLARAWKPLLSVTVSEELAFTEGVRVRRLEFAFLLLVSAVVALAMQVVGLLLTVSLLVIPAAAARPLASSPERMALFAAMAGSLAVIGGLAASARYDTPAGPSIVLAAVLAFLLSRLLPVSRAK